MRPQPSETPPELALLTSLSLAQAPSLSSPLLLAFPALSLCPEVISLAKIINCHLSPRSLGQVFAQQMFTQKFLCSLASLHSFVQAI